MVDRSRTNPSQDNEDAPPLRSRMFPPAVQAALTASRQERIEKRRAAEALPQQVQNGKLESSQRPPRVEFDVRYFHGLRVVRRNSDALVRGKLKPGMTFNQAADMWRAATNFGVVGQGYLHPGTLHNYDEKLKALSRFFGDKVLKDIDHASVRKYQELRVLGTFTREVFKKRSLSGTGPGPQLINREVGLLLRILRLSGAWTPAIEEMYLPLHVEMRDIPRAMTAREQHRFLAVAESKERWTVIHSYSTVALHTCLSTQELRNLRRMDINLDQGILTVPARGSKNPYRLRTIRLNRTAREALLSLMRRARRRGSMNPEHFIFPFRVKTGHFDPMRPMNDGGLQPYWNEVRKASDLHWLRPYDLRHTAITRFAENGTPIPVIMEFAGHVTLKMIAHYTHISEMAKQKASEQVGAATVPAMNPQNGRKPNQSTKGRTSSGGISLGLLIDNLRATGMAPDSILQIIKASSG